MKLLTYCSSFTCFKHICLIRSRYIKFVKDRTIKRDENVFFLFLLWFNVPVNNFSVMLRRSHLFLGITDENETAVVLITKSKTKMQVPL